MGKQKLGMCVCVCVAVSVCAANDTIRHQSPTCIQRTVDRCGSKQTNKSVMALLAAL